MASQTKDHHAQKPSPIGAAGQDQCCPPAVRPVARTLAGRQVTGRAGTFAATLAATPATTPGGIPSAVVPPDELAARRARKARHRDTLARFVENRLQALEHEEKLVIPGLHVVITGSVAFASALLLVQWISEGSLQQHGTPWVHVPEDLWTSYSALSPDDWRAARATLRSWGLIGERSHYDVDQGLVITELAFMPEQFALEVDRVRARIRADALNEVRQGRTL